MTQIRCFSQNHHQANALNLFFQLTLLKFSYLMCKPYQLVLNLIGEIHPHPLYVNPSNQRVRHLCKWLSMIC